MNGKEDITVMNKIKKLQHTKILILSCHEEEFYGLRYIKNGADGYLQKYSSEANIVQAVDKILKKGYYYSDVLQKKLAKVKKSKVHVNPIDSLSNREFEIAKMLVNGSGNLEIANKLNIQMSTVSTYKNRVFEKLQINNVMALSQFFK
jgi:DNA-binding NarL/FixJ family response regulator